MSKIEEGIYYSESHEFVRVEGDEAYIGITDYAQHELGNGVYVDMAPVSGIVTAVNDELEDKPEQINQDAFASWIIKVKLTNKDELNQLMDMQAYKAFIEK